jgi:hypothetical protein
MLKKLFIVGACLLVVVGAFGGAAWLSTAHSIPTGGQIMFDAGIALVAGFVIYNILEEGWE